MPRKPMNFWAGSVEDLAIAHDPSDANDKGGYIRISRDAKILYMHRWIWEQTYGAIPEGHEIDHINGVRTDNRLENLRCIPQSDNKRNVKRRVDNSSGVLGVSLWKTSRRGSQPILMWRAVAINQEGRQVIKAFSVSKYGYDEAFHLACQARKEMSEQFNYHPNHGR